MLLFDVHQRHVNQICSDGLLPRDDECGAVDNKKNWANFFSILLIYVIISCVFPIWLQWYIYTVKHLILI